METYYKAAGIDGNHIHVHQSSPDAIVVRGMHHLFASNDEFLDYLQQVIFDYFWHLANPTNGLVPDRTATGSPCSIAVGGFGLTALCIGVDHGWMTRSQASSLVEHNNRLRTMQK